MPTILISGLLVGLLGFSLGTAFDGLERQRFDSVNEDLPEDLNYESVDEVYDELRENFAGDLSEAELMTGLKRGLVDAAGDEFTTYLDEEESRELEESLNGEFSGIGAEIGKRDDEIVVIAPLDGTPADQAGLREQDVIVEIDGESTEDMDIQRAVNRIRGEEGTDVTLTIVRESNQPQDITITRGHIEIPSVEHEMLENDIGHIELIRFGGDTSAEFDRAVKDLREDGAERFVLDVRSNPGGLLESAVDVTSEFLESGEVVVEERRRDEVKSTHKARGNGVLEGADVVVLVNEGSASGSEIIAGALQEHDVAQLVGQPTFGKGSVQELVELSGDNVLRVTIAQWYTPEGRNINEEGIEPDVEVEITQEDMEAERDPQLEKAIQLLSEE